VLFNHPRSPEPRASRIHAPGFEHLRTEIWMGGADSLHGERLGPSHVEDAWIIDVAGEMPHDLRKAAALWLPRVFVDIEVEPPNIDWLYQLANSVAAAVHGQPSTEGDAWPHPVDAPARIYVMCQHGMNRSGLVTGLILRAVGVGAEETLASIATRPGALNNQTYERLVRSFEPLAYRL